MAESHEQAPLFYDDEHQAIRRVIEEGLGYKKTAGHLWPWMKPESAYAKLKHAVAGTNGESLKFGEVIAICRLNGRFDAIFHACDELGLHRPVRKVVTDEKARLTSIMESTAQTLANAMDALRRLREDEERDGPPASVSRIGR